MPKNILTDYLSFTKKERNGIIILLVLIAILILVPFLFPFFIKEKPAEIASFKNQMEQLKIKQADTTVRKYAAKNYDENNNQYYRESENKNEYSKIPKGELFNFDPNTLDESGWKRLGIKDKTIKTIQNFLSKKGHFYKPEDIGKIWGLHPDEIERLIPFVKIESTNTSNYPDKKNYENKAYEKVKYTPSVVEINSADTSSLIALPGIGSKLSQRILNYRDKLGGFYKVEQISETFGLSDSTFQKLKPRFTISKSSLRQININIATLDEMKTHPYLRYVIANAIIQYRNQHGNYSTVEDLRKIVLITDEIFNKAAPYLKVN